MVQADFYKRIFEYPPTNVAGLVFIDPDQIENNAKSREIAAWELLLGSMQLRRAGERSPAIDWLNHATHLSVENDIFKAELLGEAGQGLYESDRLQEAYKILNSAEAIWRDVCEQAVNACKGSENDAADVFASHLLPMFAAAKAKPLGSKATVQSGAQAVPMVRQWLSERAVLGRAQTTDTFVRLLAKSGQIEAARRVLNEEIEWIARDFTSPAKPVPVHTLNQRQMSPTTRKALYLLFLAEGEVELSAGEFEKSVDGFAAAAAVYENKVEDASDINRLLRAKFNQANSLLRLKRIDEALEIYELCEHGFNSINEIDSAQRVAHAKLFAQTMTVDDDDS